MIVLGIILAILLVLVAVVLVRAAQFKPQETVRPQAASVEINKEKIVEDMVDMIRCKTVSYREEALIDRAEFAKFEALLGERFPLIYQACTFQKIGKTGIISLHVR